MCCAQVYTGIIELRVGKWRHDHPNSGKFNQLYIEDGRLIINAKETNFAWSVGSEVANDVVLSKIL